MHLLARTSHVSVGLCLLGLLTTVAESKSTIIPPGQLKKFIPGQTYDKLNLTTFQELASLASMGLPANLTDEQRLQIIKEAGGPGSINMACVSLSCPQHYLSCIRGAKDCDYDFACVEACSATFDTGGNSSIPVERQLLDCYTQCDLDSNSAIFKRLKICAQSSGCIQKFTLIDAPIPSFVSASPLSELAGTWNIVAGLNPSYDHFDGSSIFFNTTSRVVITSIPQSIDRIEKVQKFKKVKKFKKKVQKLIEKLKKGGKVKKLIEKLKKGGKVKKLIEKLKKGRKHKRSTSVSKPKKIEGRMTQLFSGVYYYTSPTAQGAWYNLGTSKLGNVVVLYYTSSNELSNWFGAVVIKKVEKGATNILSKDEKEEVKQMLEQAFVIPDTNPGHKMDLNPVVNAWGTCENPTKDLCADTGFTCCISKSLTDVVLKKYTCRPKDHCSAFPPPLPKNGKGSSLVLTGDAVSMPDTTDGFVTFDDFKLLNVPHTS